MPHWLVNVPKDPKLVTKARNAVIEQLIAQRLIVQEAKREKLDKSQPYLLAQRRAEGEILANLLTQRVLQGLRTADDAAIDKYIADNPTKFADRIVFQTEQIRAPVAAIDPASFKDLHSLEAIIAKYQAMGIKVSRTNGSVDSLMLLPAATRKLSQLPVGEPFIQTDGGSLVVAVITNVSKEPLSGQQARTAAANYITQQNGAVTLQRQYDALRKSAQIRYKAGFDPRVKSATAASAP